MPASTDRLEFTPPQQPGAMRSFVLAVLAHLVLIAALTMGLKWKRDSQDLAAEAELWSSVPQQAAPKEVVPPPPPPQPKPVAKPEPKPEPKVNEADIALQQEKKRKELEAKRRQEELEREREKQKKLEAQRKQEELKKEEQRKEALAEQKKKEEAQQQKKKREEEQARKLAQLREENMRRMQGLAGATGGPSATGTAARSSGPSASYAGRVAALIRQHTRFVDSVPGDPSVEVEIRLAPDGTIVGQPRIVKSSGNAARDEAVVRGIISTEKLPRDSDGRIYSPMIVSVRQFN